MKKILAVLAALTLCVAAQANAGCTGYCNAAGCIYGNVYTGFWCYMSQTPVDSHPACVWMSCEMIGGSGGHEPPVRVARTQDEESRAKAAGEAWLLSLTDVQKIELCRGTPGCTLYHNGILVAKNGTWGALKSHYR